MSHVIKQALANLDYAIRKLEGSADYLEHSLSGQQRDMFAASSAGLSRKNGVAAANMYSDKAIIAEKLDNAIERMEELLETA